VNDVHDDDDAVAGVRLVDGLFELAPLLAGQMESTLAERGLTLARSTVLWQLHRGGAASQRDLAAALNVSPRNITALVDALVSGGFVERRSHATDRRVRLVGMTDKGAAAAEQMARERVEFAAWLFGDCESSAVDTAGGLVRCAVELLRSGPTSEPTSTPSGNEAQELDAGNPVERPATRTEARK
jgi:DNA-binding MarR family transcriptional regulator